MSEKARQYDEQAEGWSDAAYADSERYLERRARLVVELGPPLAPGDRVLDLAAGDGGLGQFLGRYGVDYLAVDASASMVEAARRRGRAAELGDLNEYEPAAPVAATTCFRALYYARDRAAFFRRVARYTERKLVFDLNPRQYALAEVERELGDAGFTGLALHPFFTPQTVALPSPLGAALRLAERVPPLARIALRFRFTYVCAASL